MKYAIFYCEEPRKGKKLDNSKIVELKRVDVAVFHLGNKYNICFSRLNQISIDASENPYCSRDIRKIKKKVRRYIRKYPNCLHQGIVNNKPIIELVA